MATVSQEHAGICYLSDNSAVATMRCEGHGGVTALAPSGGVIAVGDAVTDEKSPV